MAAILKFKMAGEDVVGKVGTKGFKIPHLKIDKFGFKKSTFMQKHEI